MLGILNLKNSLGIRNLEYFNIKIDLLDNYNNQKVRPLIYLLFIYLFVYLFIQIPRGILKNNKMKKLQSVKNYKEKERAVLIRIYILVSVISCIEDILFGVVLALLH